MNISNMSISRYKIMDEKQFLTPAPFGVATKRFARLGFHPNLDRMGTYKKASKVGPGSYKPKYPGCQSKKGISWSRKLELEEFSKYLNYKNMDILYDRQFQKTLGGPAVAEINSDIFKQCRKSIFDDVGFGLEKRFRNYVKEDIIPPPDTYFRKMEQLSTSQRKDFSTLPTFERDGFVDRFRSHAPKHTLAPNRYTLPDIDGGIDSTLKKIVSHRGPYDLFTGPRDNSTIKNHFTPSVTKVPDYYYISPSAVDVLLHHPSKSRTGKFLKCVRFPKKPCVRHIIADLSLCYRNPNDPGPAHYDLFSYRSIIEAEPNLHPFNTSSINARPPLNWTIFPGPGRYNPKQPRCLKPKKPSSIFLSKATRSLPIPEDFTLY